MFSSPLNISLEIFHVTGDRLVIFICGLSLALFQKEDVNITPKKIECQSKDALIL